MKVIRSLIIGLTIGGAFGAKIGAYLGQLSEFVQMDLITSGLILGSMFGAAAAIATIMKVPNFDRAEIPFDGQLPQNTYSLPN